MLTGGQNKPMQSAQCELMDHFLEGGGGAWTIFAWEKTSLAEKIAWFNSKLCPRGSQTKGRRVQLPYPQAHTYIDCQVTNLSNHFGKSGSQHYAWQWKFENSNFLSLPPIIIISAFPLCDWSAVPKLNTDIVSATEERQGYGFGWQDYTNAN